MFEQIVAVSAGVLVPTLGHVSRRVELYQYRALTSYVARNYTNYEHFSGYYGDCTINKPMIRPQPKLLVIKTTFRIYLMWFVRVILDRNC